MSKMNAFMYVTWLQGDKAFEDWVRERAMGTCPWILSLHLHVMKMTVWGANTEFLSSSFLTENTLMSISSDGKSIKDLSCLLCYQNPLENTRLKTPAKQQTHLPVSQKGIKHLTQHSGPPSLATAFLAPQARGGPGPTEADPDIWCQISSLQLISWA